MGLSLDPCARLGAESVGGPFGGDGMILGLGLSAGAVPEHFFARAGMAWSRLINRQRAAAARWQRDVFRGARWRRSQVNTPSLSHDRKALIEARLRPPAKSYRSWPRPIPRIPALRLRAPSVRFIALAIFATGVRAFECALSSLTSSFDQGLRCAVVFFVGTNNLPDTLVRRGES